MAELKKRKITLDTGATTFWHAVALFCDHADLSEASLEDLPHDNPWWPRTYRELILKGGKAKNLPTDGRWHHPYSGNDQKRARPGNWYKGEITLPLEVSLEPKLKWKSLYKMLESTWQRTVDDQGQKLSEVIPKGELDVSSNPPRIRKTDPVVEQRMSIIPFPPRSKWGFGLTSVLILELNKGAKEATSLKELKGSLTMPLRSEMRPVIVVDKLNEAAGKTFKGAEGQHHQNRESRLGGGTDDYRDRVEAGRHNPVGA